MAKYLLTNNTSKTTIVYASRAKKVSLEELMETKLWNKLDKSEKDNIEYRLTKPSYTVVIMDNNATQGNGAFVFARTSKKKNYFDWAESFDENWHIWNVR